MMILLLFGFILLFITILQAFIPVFLKPTLIFGLNVPDQHAKDKEILLLKKIYRSRSLGWLSYLCDLFSMGAQSKACRGDSCPC